MPRLEIMFDYACPYCYEAHQYLAELLPDYRMNGRRLDSIENIGVTKDQLHSFLDKTRLLNGN